MSTAVPDNGHVDLILKCFFFLVFKYGLLQKNNVFCLSTKEFLVST